MSMTKIDRAYIKNMSLDEISQMIDLLFARSDVLEQGNLAFLLSVASEEARLAAGLPEMEPPSLYQADASTAETLDPSGEFEL